MRSGVVRPGVVRSGMARSALVWLGVARSGEASDLAGDDSPARSLWEGSTMLRVFSHGGGVQSTGALVLAARKAIDFPTFLFCLTGEDSENPATLDYIRDHAIPYAEGHGIALLTLQKRRRTGEVDTVLDTLMRRPRSIDIPIWLESGAPGNRQCTLKFKREVVARYTKAQGATPENPAAVGVGFSLDEFHRMRTGSGIAWETREYPLVDARLTRDDCKALIAEAGLPEPPKSACWMCPYHTTEQWLQIREGQPDLWQKALALEDMLNARRADIGRDAIYLSSKRIPLRLLAPGEEATPPLCAIGHCMT